MNYVNHQHDKQKYYPHKYNLVVVVVLLLLLVVLVLLLETHCSLLIPMPRGP
jgi:hypothetical protein